MTFEIAGNPHTRSPVPKELRMPFAAFLLTLSYGLVFLQESFEMQLLFFREFHEDLLAPGIAQLSGEILEVAMRAPFQLHRDVEGLQFGRSIIHLRSQQVFLR